MNQSALYKTAVYVTAFSVAEKFFGFVYRIVLSRTLGPEGMGLYQTALSVFAVLATAAASGIPLTVSRLITKYRAKHNKNAQHSVVTAALLAALCFSVPVFCLLFFGHSLFDFLFTDSRCMSILLVLLPSLTFNSVYSVLRGALWGNKKFLPYCVIDLAEELCMIGCGVLLVTQMTSVFDGARRVALAVVLSYLLSFSMAAAYYFFKGGKLRSPRGQLRPLLSSALPLTGMRTSNALVNTLISLLLPARLIAAGMSRETAMSAIGTAMGMSMPVLGIPATLIGALALVMVPELAENYYKHEHAKLRANIERAIKITVLITCLLLPPLFALGEDVGLILFGNRLSGEIVRNCCIILLPMGVSMITTSILNSIGYEKRTFLYFFAGAAVTLLCVWLLPRFCGIYSVVIGIGASSCVTAVLNLRLIAKTGRDKIHYKKYTLLAAASMFPAAAFALMLRNTLAALLPAVPAAIVCGVIVLAAEALFVLVLGLARTSWLRLFAKAGKKKKAPPLREARRR